MERNDEIGAQAIIIDAKRRYRHRDPAAVDLDHAP
jgi:hypothetical protein